jgi:hypothetical protein
MRQQLWIRCTVPYIHATMNRLSSSCVLFYVLAYEYCPLFICGTMLGGTGKADIMMLTLVSRRARCARSESSCDCRLAMELFKTTAVRCKSSTCLSRLFATADATAFAKLFCISAMGFLPFAPAMLAMDMLWFMRLFMPAEFMPAMFGMGIIGLPPMFPMPLKAVMGFGRSVGCCGFDLVGCFKAAVAADMADCAAAFEATDGADGAEEKDEDEEEDEKEDDEDEDEDEDEDKEGTGARLVGLSEAPELVLGAGWPEVVQTASELLRFVAPGEGAAA